MTKCSGCAREVLGSVDDPLTCREDGEGPWEVLCRACARRILPPAPIPSFLLRRMGVDVGIYWPLIHRGR